MPDSPPKLWTLSTQPDSIAGYQRRVRVQRPVAADLPLQAQLLAVGRQDQFNGGRAEPDPVIQGDDLVTLVDAAQRDHRLQDLHQPDALGIAGEQRLEEERPVGLHHQIHPVAGNIDAGQLVRPDDLVGLHDHDAVVEGGRLGDGRRVLGVRAGIQVALLDRRPMRTAARHRAAGRSPSARTARRRYGSRRSTRCRQRRAARSARSAVPRRRGRVWRRCPAQTGRGARCETPTRSAYAGRAASPGRRQPRSGTGSPPASGYRPQAPPCRPDG